MKGLLKVENVDYIILTYNSKRKECVFYLTSAEKAIETIKKNVEFSVKQMESSFSNHIRNENSIQGWMGNINYVKILISNFPNAVEDNRSVFEEKNGIGSVLFRSAMKVGVLKEYRNLLEEMKNSGRNGVSSDNLRILASIDRLAMEFRENPGSSEFRII